MSERVLKNFGLIATTSLLLWTHAARADGSLGESKFNQLVIDFHEAVQPQVQQRGGSLRIQTYWSEDLLTRGSLSQLAGPSVPPLVGVKLLGGANAFADDEGQWGINIVGGVARHEAITPDGFLFILCHELGHHILGKSSETMQGERMVDLYAIQTCLPILWNISAFDMGASDEGTSNDHIPESVLRNCSAPGCARTLRAALSVANYTYQYHSELFGPSGRRTMPSFSATALGPEDVGQCRLEVVSSALLGKPLPKCFK